MESSGKVLITGANRGLGAALAKAFTDSNNDLFLHTRAAHGDLTNPKTIDFLVDAAKEFKIDTLVNNAGVYLGKPAEETTQEELANVMNVNFYAPAMLTSRLLPYFKSQKRGVIVNINSLAGKQGSKNESAYAASKHALKGFMDSLRYEVSASEIRIIDVFSGAIATDMTKSRPGYDLLIQPDEEAAAIVRACMDSGSVYQPELTFVRRRR